MKSFRFYCTLVVVLVFCRNAYPQDLSFLDQYNPVWDSPSANSGESMPVGGGDIGLNSWVENGELIFYIGRSGAFDENNTLLKLGRTRIKLSPNPFENSDNFRQELVLKDGFLEIQAGDTKIEIWVDVHRPMIHLELESKQAISMAASYESWRYKDRTVTGKANNANSYKWALQGEVITYADKIDFDENGVLFFHRNKTEPTVFDIVVAQQKLDEVKEQLYNPISNLTFGGWIGGNGLIASQKSSGVYQDTDYEAWELKSEKPSKQHQMAIYLHTNQTTDQKLWLDELVQFKAENKPNTWKKNKAESRKWWRDFWDRSHVVIDPDKRKDDSVWNAGKNYQLFRYMLACNAYGTYPTKFNGGLFTVDPFYTDSTYRFTPDHRNWGGGTMTAQNQRLVYFPMLASGDFDMLPSQLDFYLNLLKNAELRSKVYWGHAGASFTEQLENFALPNPAEYGWKRPKGYDPGMQYNAWLEYQWDTVLEFCLMMLELERYDGQDISKYIPFIESCLTFFDEHYQYLARNRGAKVFDQNGHLVLYPGTANETYKMAYNANSTISGLKVITQRLLELPEGYLGEDQKSRWEKFLATIPPLNLRETNGHTVLSPAKLWERVNNTESPQMYPVYPWKLYGLGLPNLDFAWNTWHHDPDVEKFRSHVGWKQDNIFAARMGMVGEAAEWTLKKMADSGRRFPAFWGPGFDWVPDHNWGGSGMIGIQEMLLQTLEDKIYLFPAWPKDWDVDFKLYAAYQTTITGSLRNGKLENLHVSPAHREKDIINLLDFSMEEKKELGDID